MLNEYLPNRLLREELLKRDWMLQNVKKDNAWEGSKIIVPFKGAGASTIGFGSLASSGNISQDTYVRGSIDDYQELWGSMIFNHRDLVDHDAKIPEGTFLKLVEDTVDDFVGRMKMITSVALISGPHFAKATADGTAGGVLAVNFVDRFEIGQEVILDDDNSTQGTYYVIAMSIDASTVTLSATRGGAAADISAYTLSQNAKVYHPGSWDGTTASTFVSARSALLSAANGGSTTIHGQTKTAYPFLQAPNISGATATSANLLDVIFKAYAQIQQKARGNANTVLMSLANLGVILQLIQIEKGSFHVAPGQTKVSEFGWQEIMIGSPAGQMLKFVGVQEADNDVIFFLDMKSMVFRSKGFFKRHAAPDGREYFVVRNTTGYQYILDYKLFGEMEWTKPGNNGVLHSLSLSYT
jgi:hypothetical protein